MPAGVPAHHRVAISQGAQQAVLKAVARKRRGAAPGGRANVCQRVLEAAYHRADAAIQNVIDLLVAA